MSTKTKAKDRGRLNAHEEAFFERFLAGNDHHACAILGVILDMHGEAASYMDLAHSAFVKTREEASNRVQARAACALKILRSDVVAQGSLPGIAVYAKTFALLWSTILMGLVDPNVGLPAHVRLAYLRALRSNPTQRRLVDKERDAISGTMRAMFDLMPASKATRLCAQVFSTMEDKDWGVATADGLLRDVARTLVQKANIRHLKVLGQVAEALGDDSAPEFAFPFYGETFRMAAALVQHTIALKDVLEHRCKRTVEIAKITWQEIQLRIVDIERLKDDGHTEIKRYLAEYGHWLRQCDTGDVGQYKLVLNATTSPSKGGKGPWTNTFLEV